MPSNRPRQPRRRYDRLAILAYVASYQQQHQQRSPSQRRIQRALGISAPSVVHTILHRLAQAGLLTITTYERGAAADLTLTPTGRVAVERWQQPHAAAKGKHGTDEARPPDRRHVQNDDQTL